MIDMKKEVMKILQDILAIKPEDSFNVDTVSSCYYSGKINQEEFELLYNLTCKVLSLSRNASYYKEQAEHYRLLRKDIGDEHDN